MDVSPPSWTAFMILCLTSIIHPNCKYKMTPVVSILSLYTGVVIVMDLCTCRLFWLTFKGEKNSGDISVSMKLLWCNTQYGLESIFTMIWLETQKQNAHLGILTVDMSWLQPTHYSFIVNLNMSTLLPASGCLLEVDCKGKLTVDPGPLVEWGSSLSVFCQINECSATQNPFSIKLNQQPLHPLEQNCSTARFHISNMTDLKSTLVCLVGVQVVCGLDLRSGCRLL